MERPVGTYSGLIEYYEIARLNDIVGQASDLPTHMAVRKSLSAGRQARKDVRTFPLPYPKKRHS